MICAIFRFFSVYAKVRWFQVKSSTIRRIFINRLSSCRLFDQFSFIAGRCLNVCMRFSIKSNKFNKYKEKDIKRRTFSGTKEHETAASTQQPNYNTTAPNSLATMLIYCWFFIFKLLRKCFEYFKRCPFKFL